MRRRRSRMVLTLGQGGRFKVCSSTRFGAAPLLVRVSGYNLSVTPVKPPAGTASVPHPARVVEGVKHDRGSIAGRRCILGSSSLTQGRRRDLFRNDAGKANDTGVAARSITLERSATEYPP
jgi:hypothetical protein